MSDEEQDGRSSRSTDGEFVDGTGLVRNQGGYPQGIGNEDYPVSTNGRVRCHGTNRYSKRCAKYAMLGAKYCKKHGGARHDNLARAEGRYADLFKSNATLRELFLKMWSDPDICDLRSELALQRALLSQYLVLASKHSLGLAGPEVAPVITELNRSIAQLADAVHKVEKRGDGFVSIHQLDDFMDLVMSILVEHVDDERVLNSLAVALEGTLVPSSSVEDQVAYLAADGYYGTERALHQDRGEGGSDGSAGDSPESESTGSEGSPARRRPRVRRSKRVVGRPASDGGR